MRSLSISLSLSLFLFLMSCSAQNEKRTYISGTITVDTTLDATGDFSGIDLFIFTPPADGRRIDTLFSATTARDGSFSGIARFESRGLSLSRNGEQIASKSVIMGEDGSLLITGQIPNFSRTAKLESRENRAYAAYDRVQRNLGRILTAVQRQAVSQDTLPHLLRGVSDLYWTVQTNYEGTLAADLSMMQGIQILEGIDDDALLDKYNRPEVPGNIRIALSDPVKNIVASRDGVVTALQFLDSLKNVASNNAEKLTLDKNGILLLMDSLNQEGAHKRLAAFQAAYGLDERSKNWADAMQFDLDNLFFGQPMFEFSLSTYSDQEVTNEVLKGSPYMLEITSLANQVYQEEYKEIAGIHLLYGVLGFNIITIPLEETEVVNAFFTEREKYWPFANVTEEEKNDFLRKMNVYGTPTRILVDAEGNIVRKYSGTAANQILRDFKILTQQQQQKQQQQPQGN